MPATADPDAAEVAAAQVGQRSAYLALVERHQAELARLLWRFAHNHADLEDLVQETFLRMVRHLPAWRAERPFAHWLRHIAVNVGRDHLRRQNVRARWLAEPPSTFPSSSALDAAPAPFEAADPGPDPGARAAANEIKDLLAQLPPDDRALLTLQHLEGWPLGRIAAAFGWTVTATKLRAWRARHRLRATLKPRDLS